MRSVLDLLQCAQKLLWNLGNGADDAKSCVGVTKAQFRSFPLNGHPSNVPGCHCNDSLNLADKFMLHNPVGDENNQTKLQ